MFALAMYMQYNQKERAKMKVSILKTIAESDISTEQKIMLDEYIEQAFELNPKEKETYQELVQQEPIMVRKFLTAADRYLEGKAEGKAEGNAEGLLNAIYKILQKQGKQIDDAQKSIFSHIQDTKLLDEMLEVSLTQNITVDQLLQLAQKQSPTP